MNTTTTFDSTKESLSDLLRSIAEGKTQLPDFQRGWVWDDEHIRSLLASVSLSFPIGTVMMLATGNEQVRFRPRLVEGVQLQTWVEPERLILDGQQRLTSLFQSLWSGRAVATRDSRKKARNLWYYIDIAKALDPNGDRDEAVISLPEDRIVRNFRGEVIADYSSPEKEYEAGLFPLLKLFSSSDWRRAYSKYWKYDDKHMEMFDGFEDTIIKRFEQYQMPKITLSEATPKEAVCIVFEKVNTGGVSLTVFELMTATFAADDYNLRDDWQRRKELLSDLPVLDTVTSDDLLQAITLLATYQRNRDSINYGISRERSPGVSCKRKDILRLSLAEYLRWVDAITEGFKRAAKLLYSQKIFTARDLPYRTQLVPLAAVYALLGDRANTDSVRTKLMQWYWCGVLGELYGSAIETRFAKDLPEILVWIEGGNEPDTIRDANFVPARLYTLRTRNSAAYKGIYALLLRDGGQDFRSGEPIDVQMYTADRIDIHHIFPRGWCEKQGIDKRRYDSIINKTPLAAKTNQMIGSKAPSSYLQQMQQQAGVDPGRMDQMLYSHVIDPIHIRNDHFENFLVERERALLQRIERAMGKPILTDSVLTVDDFGLDEEDE
ncbi:MAG: DUF262 domain-containing protein [Caldilineaceae bacterium]|nr:DUF262 domain-containing protein [Caldilineaceae bacterium]